MLAGRRLDEGIIYKQERSPHLRCPAHRALPRWSPQLAGLGEMLPLLQLLLANVASHQRAAMLIHTMPKMLARHTHA
jgi:hypothetical protein